jgi:hypothetical protein
MPEVCSEDGPPLSMVGYLRGFTELQTIYAISDLHNNVLLFLLRSVSNLGMVRDSKRRAVRRDSHAS